MAKEKEVTHPDVEQKKKAEDKVDDKKDDAKKEGVPAGSVDPIGIEEKPKDDAPASEWREWAKGVDIKIDKIVKACVKEEPAPKVEKGFWDF